MSCSQVSRLIEDRADLGCFCEAGLEALNKMPRRACERAATGKHGDNRHSRIPGKAPDIKIICHTGLEQGARGDSVNDAVANALLHQCSCQIMRMHIGNDVRFDVVTGKEFGVFSAYAVFLSI